MNKISATILGAVLSAASVAAHADTITFASFANADFVFTNSGTSGYSNLNVAGGAAGDSVLFAFNPLVYSQLVSSALEGSVNAHMKINGGAGVTTTANGYKAGTTFFQPFNETMVLSFTLDQAFTPTTGDKAGQALSNLLTVTLTPGAENFELGGKTTSASGTFDGVNYSLSYTSEFLDFSNQVAADGGFTFSGLSPQLGLVNGFLKSFTAQGTGTFAADPAPTMTVTTTPPAPNAVPEPGSIALLGVGLVALAAARRRRQA